MTTRGPKECEATFEHDTAKDLCKCDLGCNTGQKCFSDAECTIAYTPTKINTSK